MAGYTKEFLIDAFMSRYFEILSCSEEEKLRDSAEALYARVGRDKFRTYACLDAEALRKYKEDFNC